MRRTGPGLRTTVVALCGLDVPLRAALGITTLGIEQRHEIRVAFAGTHRP